MPTGPIINQFGRSEFFETLPSGFYAFLIFYSFYEICLGGQDLCFSQMIFSLAKQIKDQPVLFIFILFASYLIGSIFRALPVQHAENSTIVFVPFKHQTKKQSVRLKNISKINYIIEQIDSINKIVDNIIIGEYISLPWDSTYIIQVMENIETLTEGINNNKIDFDNLKERIGKADEIKEVSEFIEKINSIKEILYNTKDYFWIEKLISEYNNLKKIFATIELRLIDVENKMALKKEDYPPFYKFPYPDQLDTMLNNIERYKSEAWLEKNKVIPKLISKVRTNEEKQKKYIPMALYNYWKASLFLYNPQAFSYYQTFETRVRFFSSLIWASWVGIIFAMIIYMNSFLKYPLYVILAGIIFFIILLYVIRKIYFSEEMMIKQKNKKYKQSIDTIINKKFINIISIISIINMTILFLFIISNYKYSIYFITILFSIYFSIFFFMSIKLSWIGPMYLKYNQVKYKNNWWLWFFSIFLISVCLSIDKKLSLCINSIHFILLVISIIILFSFGSNFYNIRRQESQILLSLFIAYCQKEKKYPE